MISMRMPGRACVMVIVPELRRGAEVMDRLFQ
jgi:hypothetical protein